MTLLQFHSFINITCSIADTRTLFILFLESSCFIIKSREIPTALLYVTKFSTNSLYLTKLYVTFNFEIASSVKLQRNPPKLFYQCLLIMSVYRSQEWRTFAKMCSCCCVADMLLQGGECVQCTLYSIFIMPVSSSQDRKMRNENIFS